MNIVSDEDEGRRILAAAVAAAERVVVFTGAGISTESGIPDFRSPGGLWTRVRPIPFAEFVASEEARLEDWRRRFASRRRFDEAQPNAAHDAIAGLVAAGRVTAVITQNIDGLHERSGVPEERLVRLHGTGMHAACLDCGLHVALDAAEADIAASGRAPVCAACGGLVKAAVVSFGQAMPADAMARAEAAVRGCDLMLAVGSSLQVYPAAGFPVLARRLGARLIIVNRDETGLDDLADTVVRGTIGTLFEALKPLGQRVPHVSIVAKNR